MESLLNYTDVAKILGVQPRTIRDWTSKHKIPHIKIGQTVRYRESDVQDWTDKRFIESA